MITLGIDCHRLLVYEGQGIYGQAIWPAPILTIATLLDPTGEHPGLPTSTDLGLASLLFREDSFDPVTRLRRGRLYARASAEQPRNWLVQPHPAFAGETGYKKDPAGRLQKSVYAFSAYSAHNLRSSSRPYIALGVQDFYTIWRVVHIERIYTGEDFLTLRAQSFLGILPEIDYRGVPGDAAEKVREVLEKLDAAAYKSGPESIIDRARDAAQWCLAVWLSKLEGDEKLRHLDLGSIVHRIDERRTLLRNAAQSIARLHARGKPNVQDRFGLRALRESDAEFAIAAVGILLREIGWAV